MYRFLAMLALLIFLPIFLTAQPLKECASECDTLYKKGDYQKGLEIALTCRDLAKQATGGRDSIYSTMLMRVGNFQYRLGKSAEAVATCTELIEVRKLVFGPESGEVATAMHSLGNALTQQGRLLESQKTFLESLAIREKNGGKKVKPYAATINSLGIIAIELGNMHEAEAYFSQACDLYRDLIGENTRDFILALGNLAQVNTAMGNYERSMPLLRRSLAIREATFGTDHSMYASGLLAIAELYDKTEYWAEADPFIRKALAIRQKWLGEDHHLTLQTLSSLAKIMLETGKIDSAEVVIRDAFMRYSGLPDATDVIRADFLNDLGDVFLRKNQPDSAQACFEKAYFFQKKILPDARIGYLRSLQSMALSSGILGQVARADSFYREAQAIQFELLGVLFPHFSERERQLNFAPVAKEIERFATFADRSADELPVLAGQLLDLRLATRGILFSASQKMYEQFRLDGNLADFETWRQSRERLAQLYLTPPEKPEMLGFTLAELSENIRLLEKKLGKRNNQFLQQTLSSGINWQKIRSALGPDEAAVEIIRFHKQAAQPTDEACYLALIVTKETIDRPFFIRFNDGNELEKVIFELYRAEMRQSGAALSKRRTPAFRNFWSPIEPFLAGKKRVFFALDGVFHKINFGTLRGEDGLFLSEKFDFRYLTNLADLIREPQNVAENRPFQPTTALLVGDPTFDFFENNSTAKGGGQSVFEEPFSAELRGIDLRPLPKSGEEVAEIDQILKEKHCETQVFTQKRATEGSVKSTDQPSILHLATHGFFLEQLSGKGVFDTNFVFRSRLLRSMLFFAGAENRLLNGIPNPSEDGQDGILTAFEVQNMSLENTELVTLSACQSGLGDVVSGEGVFGLQRAFRVAGAKALLMSLWNVDDEATRLLMTTFYQKWLGGMSKPDALRAAEAVVRAKFPQPEKWGGFVLIGD